jgi:transcription elongation factor Elf1
MEFKYGDLIIKCLQCGGEQVLEELVTGGRAIYILNNTDQYLRLHCPDCNISMEMRMRPSENIDDELKDEEITNIEELKTTNDEELPKEGTEEEVV